MQLISLITLYGCLNSYYCYIGAEAEGSGVFRILMPAGCDAIGVPHKCNEDVTRKQRHSKYYIFQEQRRELSHLELVKLTTQLIFHSLNFASYVELELFVEMKLSPFLWFRFDGKVLFAKIIIIIILGDKFSTTLSMRASA